MADWDPANEGDAGDYHAFRWCLNPMANTTARFINKSWTEKDTTSGPLDGHDFQADYWVTQIPYPTITVGAGNCEDSAHTSLFDCDTQSGHTVENRGFNTINVGGSNDNNTNATNDDSIAYFSAWGNPTTSHGDHELPHLVAPAVQVQSPSVTGDGTSASSPIVMGGILLGVTRDTRLAILPEETRAMLLATATHPMTGSTRLVGLPAGDVRDGAGLFNADAFVRLADPAMVFAPNSVFVPNGRFFKTYVTDSDFGPDRLSYTSFLLAASGSRLRVAISWIGMANGCQFTDGSGCSNETQAADFDLQIRNINSPNPVVCSDTFDSTWELCDIATQPGEQYELRLSLFAASTKYVPVGIAWHSYDPSAE